MSTTWLTKYGPRRVRVDLPTIEEALFAAEGLTSDSREQINIAADLMHVSVDQARAEAERLNRTRGGRSRIVVQDRRARSTVVVERKSPRRRIA